MDYNQIYIFSKEISTAVIKRFDWKIDLGFSSCPSPAVYKTE
jgi:hypothetical protein